MTQGTPLWGSQPIAEAVRKDDLLEKQLEQLFSDAVLPELAMTLGRRSQPAAEAALQPQSPFPVNIPQPAIKGRLLKPKWSKWVTWSLGVLAISTLLLVVTIPSRGTINHGNSRRTPERLDRGGYPQQVEDSTSAEAIFGVEQGNLAPSANTATPHATPATTANATTYGAPPTTTLTKLATPPRTPTSARILSTVRTPTSLPPTPQPTPMTTSAVKAEPTPPHIPARLIIPAINLEAPIITVGFVNSEINGQPASTWAVPETFAVGWHHTSAPPGQAGNTVLNGHQSVHGGVFRDLGALQPDDEIIIHAGDVAHRYRVTERHILEEETQPLAVRAENARWIMPTQDERLTLVTCAPDAKSTHRLIVVALPVTP